MNSRQPSSRRLEPLHLDVQGQLGRYRISLVWGLVALVSDSGLRWLKIPQKLLTAVPLELADLAHRTGLAHGGGFAQSVLAGQ